MTIAMYKRYNQSQRIRYIVKFGSNIWLTFQGEDQLKTSICTFLAVLSHFDIILQNISEKVS